MFFEFCFKTANSYGEVAFSDCLSYGIPDFEALYINCELSSGVMRKAYFLFYSKYKNINILE